MLIKVKIIILLVIIGILPIILLSSCLLMFGNMVSTMAGGLIVYYEFHIHQSYLEDSYRYSLLARSFNYDVGFADFLAYGMIMGQSPTEYEDVIRSGFERLHFEQMLIDSTSEKYAEFEDVRNILEYSTGGIIGPYEKEYIIYHTIIVDGIEHSIPESIWEEQWGLRLFHPFSKKYNYVHLNDFGDPRSFGGNRNHEGNDFMAEMGTPIKNIEAGIVEDIGWSEYGGWYITVRSLNGIRYYYYAHLDRYAGYQVGDKIEPGEVIGYVGDTGYGSQETRGQFEPHLHLQIQVTYTLDNNEKESIWINPYNFIKFLEGKHEDDARIRVTKM